MSHKVRNIFIMAVVVAFGAAVIHSLSAEIRHIQGSTFIGLWLLGVVLALVIGASIDSALQKRSAARLPETDLRDLTYQESLVLSGGDSNALIALSLMRMHFDGIIHLGENGVSLCQASKGVKSSLEGQLLAAITATLQDNSASEIPLQRFFRSESLQKSAKVHLGVIAQSLIDRGMCIFADGFFTMTTLESLMLVLGIEKLMLALQSNKPRGFLTLGVIMLGLFVVFLWIGNMVSPKADGTASSYSLLSNVRGNHETDNSSLRVYAMNCKQDLKRYVDTLREGDRPVVSQLTHEIADYNAWQKAQTAAANANSDSGCSGCSSCSSCSGCSGCGGCGGCGD